MVPATPAIRRRWRSIKIIDDLILSQYQLLRVKAEEQRNPCLHIKDWRDVWPAISPVAGRHPARCLACGPRGCQMGIVRVRGWFPPSMRSSRTSRTEFLKKEQLQKDFTDLLYIQNLQYRPR